MEVEKTAGTHHGLLKVEVEKPSTTRPSRKQINCTVTDTARINAIIETLQEGDPKIILRPGQVISAALEEIYRLAERDEEFLTKTIAQLVLQDEL